MAYLEATYEYLFLMPVMVRKESVGSAGRTGAAWLSSARVVRCSVKSGNGATLVPSCHGYAGDSSNMSRVEVEGGTRWSVWPLRPALLAHNARYNGMQWAARLSKSTKPSPVRIESATRLHEVGIASNGASATTPNTPLALHTARHIMKVGSARSREQPQSSVLRWPYRG